MRELYLFPPNYAAINAAFKVRGKPIFFAYGDAIYNPSRVRLSPALKAHEAVHLVRQRGIGPEAWWDKYIADREFRLEEELPAHQAEYRVMCQSLHSEAGRREMLGLIAHRLASPLYGSLITAADAEKLIAQGASG